MADEVQPGQARGLKLATGLSEAIFKSTRPKTIVVGPDAFAMDRGEDGFGDDPDFVETVYDARTSATTCPSPPRSG